jgi:hypothetical protein
VAVEALGDLAVLLEVVEGVVVVTGAGCELEVEEELEEVD